MRVLFVPFPTISHGIPLLALSSKLGRDIEWAFLLPQKFHSRWCATGVPVLMFDYQGSLDGELSAFERYGPDVIVDDCDLTTKYACSLTRIPRVTILRTAYLKEHQCRNAVYEYHLIPDLNKVPDFIISRGFARPNHINEIFAASRYIIPGIPSIEELPVALAEQRKYFFSGPLLVPDDTAARLMLETSELLLTRKKLEAFFQQHDGERIVFCTMGTVAEAEPQLRLAIKWMCEHRIPVVSTINVDELTSSGLFCFCEFAPIDFVCSKCFLMIHQCGSGTYHYPLLHSIRAITIGSQSIERDDIALRLRDAGLTDHLFHPADEPKFAEKLLILVMNILGCSPSEDYAHRAQLACDEINKTSAAFCLPDLLQTAASER